MEKNELERIYNILQEKIEKYDERISDDFEKVDEDSLSIDDMYFLKKIAVELDICDTRLKMIDFTSDNYDNDVATIQLYVINEKAKNILSSIKEFEEKFDINLKKDAEAEETSEEEIDELENPLIGKLRVFSRSLIGIAAAVTLVGVGVGVYKNLSKDTPKIKTSKEKAPIVTDSEEKQILTNTDDIKKAVEEEMSKDDSEDDISKYTVTFEDKEKDDTKSEDKNELKREQDAEDYNEDVAYDETYPTTIIPQDSDEQVEDTYYDRDDVVEKDGEVWIEPASVEPEYENSEFYTAPDGTIWESEEDYNNYANGEQTEETVQPTSEDGMVDGDYYVAPDGTVWSSEEEYNNYANGEQTEETVQPTSDEEIVDGDYYVAPDGTVWSSEEEYNNYASGEQTEEMGQSSNEDLTDESIDDEFYTAPDGTVWASEEDYVNYQNNISEDSVSSEDNSYSSEETTSEETTEETVQPSSDESINDEFYTAPDGTIWASEEDYVNYQN